MCCGTRRRCSGGRVGCLSPAEGKVWRARLEAALFPSAWLSAVPSFGASQGRAKRSGFTGSRGRAGGVVLVTCREFGFW